MSFVDSFGTAPYRSAHTSIKAHPAKAGAAKLRVLGSSATPSIDATKDPTTAELPKGSLGGLRPYPNLSVFLVE
jgi:hypothetical protein